MNGASPRWHPLARSVLYLGACGLVQAGVALALSLLSYLLLDDRWLGEGGLASANEVLLLPILLSAPPIVGMTWLFVRYLDRRTVASLGVRWPEGGRRAAWRQLVTLPIGVQGLLLGWLALVLALPGSLAAVRTAGLDAGFAAGPRWWPASPVLLLALLLLGFLLQGGLEEWIVRGYVYRALKERWRPWAAALASSLLFALMHAANPGVSGVALLNIVLAGMVLAALVERSGSLWSAAVAHGVWNFSVACLLSLPVSGYRVFHLLDVAVEGDLRLTGGAFGPEASALLTLLALPLAALLWRRIPLDRRDRGIRPSAPEDGVPPPPL